MTKVILISSQPLPSGKSSGWTTLYDIYLAQGQVDYVVCPTPHVAVGNVMHILPALSFFEKLKAPFAKSKPNKYLYPLRALLRSGEKYIIQVINDPGLCVQLGEYLKKEKIRKQCYIQFFYHGFSPIYNNEYGRTFLSNIDELVLGTKDSYKFFLEYYAVLTCKVFILHNAVDTKVFSLPKEQQRNDFRERYGVTAKTVFIWHAQEEKVNGLSLLLDAWKNIYRPELGIVLWVRGVKSKREMEGVVFFANTDAKETVQFHQAADVYLFPVLGSEDSATLLIQALHCGNFCIASANGAIPEILKFGNLGTLVNYPHFVSEWEKAILGYLASEKPLVQIPEKLYSAHQWSCEMDHIIRLAKEYKEN